MFQQKTDRIYFQSSSNKETKELQSMLSSLDIDLQTEAMKQIIASLSLGQDVSELFPNVINCIRTKSIPLKKLIYLYIIHYAKEKPDLVILGVASFASDAKSGESPMIRGLAIRAMSYIQVETIAPYLAEILAQGLKDEDAYVRKNAAISVSKLYMIKEDNVTENGLIDSLNELLDDSNGTVVANALISLDEIGSLCGRSVIKMKGKTLGKILNALSETSEWSQVVILDSIVKLRPKQGKQIEAILQGVLPRLSHNNPSVVMGAVKIITKFIDLVSEDNRKTYMNKVTKSIMTLMNSDYEIQYVIFRGIYALIQKQPDLFKDNYKFFFVQYNEPIYLKIEKIQLLYRLCNNNNFENVIKELKIYATTELNNDIIKQCVQYIGYIGLKYEKSVELCVSIFSEFFDSSSEVLLNEVSIVSRDIIRKYKSSSIQLLEKINSDLIINVLTDNEAKSSLIFLIGEYCNLIPESNEYIAELIETYNSNATSTDIKLQILSTAVKNFINKPDEKNSENIVKLCLKKGAEESENPDVRDRAYFFWRLLENEPDLAKEMFNEIKPNFIMQEDTLIPDNIVDDMISNMTNLSSVYHCLSQDLLLKEDDEDILSKEKFVSLEDTNVKEDKKKQEEKTIQNTSVDLLGLDLSTEKKEEKKTTLAEDMKDIFSSISTTNEQAKEVKIGDNTFTFE